ncbi:nucleotidyltransferase family protein [soil metagenome]
MEAVILAGGRGTRLRPYTMCFPKPLVPIGDYPILEVVIRQLRTYGFRKVTLLTGHLAELIQAYFGHGERWGIEIEYVREEVPLNTAGALKLVKHQTDHVLVMNGDILTTMNYRHLYERHIEKGAEATVATIRREHKVDFGVIETGSDGFLSGYREKPVLDYTVSMGVYVLSRGYQRLIGEGESLGMPDLLLRVLGDGGRVFCAEEPCYWLDIGRVDDYEEAQRQFADDPKRFLPDHA